MRKLRMLGIVLAMLVAGAVAAQGAPEQIQDALAAFNQRLGTALTLNDFFWTWEQSTFPDSALGCPADGVQPVAGTVAVKVGGVSTTPSSIDHLTGRVTFASTPSSAPPGSSRR